MYLIYHVSAETLTAGRMIPAWTNSPPADVSTTDSNKNVDIKFSKHDASSGELKCF